VKRIRIRLKAESVEDLRRGFARRLRVSGVLLPARWSLSVGEEVDVAIHFHDRRLALAGRGRLASLQPGGTHGDDFWIELTWTDASRALLRAVLAGRERTASSGFLSQDLELPAPVPRPAPVDATADVLQVSPGDPPWTVDAEAREVAGAPARDAGEVTPLARIELVRRETSSGVAEGGEAASFGLEGERPPLDPKGRCVLGVDFGSSATRIATWDEDDGFRAVPTRRGLPVLPTVVHAQPRGKTFVGEAAVRRAESDPAYGVRDFRRMMGRAFGSPGVKALAERSLFPVVEGPQGETAAGLDELVVPLEEVAGVLFKEVREASSLALADRANRAVVTVPGWGGPQLRDSCRLAAELGGLHVERLVGEAAAVALDFAERRPSVRGTVLVVSLGAGLLDSALVRVEAGRVRVEAVGGTFDVGGVDFDRALESIFVEAVEDATGERPAETPDFWARLMTTARRVKETLSDADQAVGELAQPLPNGEAFRIEVDVLRAAAEAAWAPCVDRVVEEIEALLQRTEYERIDAVIAAGGQMRMPALRASLQRLLPGSDWFDADAGAAARGAAVLGRRSASGAFPGLVEPAPRALAVASRHVEARLVFRAGISMPSSRELTLAVREGGELVLLQSGPVPGAGWSAIGRLDLDLAGQDHVNLRLSLAADGQLGIIGEVPGADWRPVGLEPVEESLRSDPWWAALELRSEGASDPGAAERGFVGWLRRRLRAP
jgi:hypothetical protein